MSATSGPRWRRTLPVLLLTTLLVAMQSVVVLGQEADGQELEVQELEVQEPDDQEPEGQELEVQAPDDDGDAEVALAQTEPLAVRASVRSVGPVTPAVRFVGSGWGHGVGMSQYGAYAQAQAGWSAPDILGHYYPGTQVTADDRGAQRIRVSILDGVQSTTVEAVGADVPWLQCAPNAAAGESIGGRVAPGSCEPWFVQPMGSTVRACAVRGEDGQGTQRDGIRIVPATGQAGCLADPLEETFSHPIARVDHDGTVIRTSSHVGTTTYRHGWRDLHSRAGGVLNSVQDVPSVELYLRGLAEVPSSWGRTGPAALRAQAITGRTFAIGRLGVAGGCACDLRATPADQNYTGYAKESETVSGGERIGDLWVAAVDATAGQVLTHQGALAQTFYSSSHGGRSENVEDSWAYGTTPIPYLRSVDDPWSSHPSAGNSRASWTASASHAAFASFVSTGRAQPVVRVERVRVLSRTEGLTPRELEVTGVTASGQRVTFVFDRRPGDAKPIAGASLRRFLPLSEGGTGGRLFSSQISSIGFAPFVDDDGHVHEWSITWAQAAGIVQGVEATRFAPNRAVTRGQMATYLVNTFEVPLVAPTGRFTDVAPGDTHAGNIESLAALGLVAGFADGSYRPDVPVTRAQMATFLAGALALGDGDTGGFLDVSGTGVHDRAIAAIAAAGITTGCTSDRFCPGDPVQRGQLATFVARVVLD